jgi:hypothetical protein
MGIPNRTFIECGSIKIMDVIGKKLRCVNQWILIIAAVSFLTACDALSPDTYWSSGDYELIAIDTKGQMMLAVDLHNGGSIGIVGPTVFALGADDQHIVIKQHPSTDHFGHFDQTVTHYFIVTRIPGTAEEKEKGVRGPLSKDEFDRVAVSNSLPPFTKIFKDLE